MDQRRLREMPRVEPVSTFGAAHLSASARQIFLYGSRRLSHATAGIYYDAEPGCSQLAAQQTRCS